MGKAKVVPILRELKEAAPIGFVAMCRGVCPHSFGLRESMRETCRELDGYFDPLFCEDCWRDALDD